MDFVLYILALVCVSVGVLASTMHYRKQLKELRLDLIEAQEDLSGSYSSGWAEGWEAAHASNRADYLYYQDMYHQIRGNE